MPKDDTIPQNNEGIEAVTCAITPKSAANLLLIIANVSFVYSSGASGKGSVALFRYSVANALAAVHSSNRADIDYDGPPVTLIHQMTAGTISETTFKIRFGSSAAGTSYLNSQHLSATRVHGGVCSTTLTIIEYAQ